MTETRPIQPTPVGALRFNTDSSKLEYFDGNQFVNITTDSPEQNTGGTRGLFQIGFDGSGYDDDVEFTNISTTGNAADFGNTSSTTQGMSMGANNNTRVVVGGGRTPSYVNVIEYFTISTTLTHRLP
mgnify:CR=1 FL=1